MKIFNLHLIYIYFDATSGLHIRIEFYFKSKRVFCFRLIPMRTVTLFCSSVRLEGKYYMFLLWAYIEDKTKTLLVLHSWWFYTHARGTAGGPRFCYRLFLNTIFQTFTSVQPQFRITYIYINNYNSVFTKKKLIL